MKNLFSPCKKHPKYRALRPPRCRCKHCHLMWIEAEARREARKEIMCQEGSDPEKLKELFRQPLSVRLANTRRLYERMLKRTTL